MKIIFLFLLLFPSGFAIGQNQYPRIERLEICDRTIEGRKLLLKSKIKSLASKFEENPERINTWR